MDWSAFQNRSCTHETHHSFWSYRAVELAGDALLMSRLLFADAGILIPRDKQQPDPAILSLEEMEITIRIDNGDARVFVRQIFANHTNAIEEGNYLFALPSHATISDFATWDGPTRIPAVILERKRAEEIYNQLKQQAIDPGLLEMGERGSEEAKRTSIFSARIVPIPAYGTKRLEIEYHEWIPVENLKSYFAIPLRPDAYSAQAARHLRINFELQSAHAIRNFQAPAKTFGLQIERSTPHVVVGHFEGKNVNLAEDFVVTYDLDPAASDTLQVLTYRNPISGQPSPTEMSPVRSTNEPGFFEAEALVGFGQVTAPAENAGRDCFECDSEDDCDFVRHFAIHAMGEIGAELSGSGDSASHAAACRSFQPRVVQQRDSGVAVDDGGCRKYQACNRSGSCEPVARRDRRAASAAGWITAGCCSGRRKFLSGDSERWWRYAWLHSEWKTGGVVCVGVEATAGSAASAHLYSCGWGRCQPALVPSAGASGWTCSNTCSRPSPWSSS